MSIPVTPPARIHPLEALPWAIAIAAFFLAGTYLSLGREVLIMALFALSIDLALGYGGIVTLGQAAFYGLGAYTAGIISVQGWGEPISGLLAATAVAALFGAITGWLILHTRGNTLLMLTIAIAALLYEVGNKATGLTGGDDGLQGISMWPLLGLFEFQFTGETAYLYALAVLFVWFVIARRIAGSSFGSAVVGIHLNPRRMHAIGTPVHLRLVSIYTVSAAMAGSAGALSAQTTAFVGLDAFQLLLSGTVVIMLVLGGAGRLYGALLGAFVYVLVHDFAAAINPFYWTLAIGVMLLLIVRFAPDGLMSLLETGWRRLSSRRR